MKIRKAESDAEVDSFIEIEQEKYENGTRDPVQLHP